MFSLVVIWCFIIAVTGFRRGNHQIHKKVDKGKMAIPEENFRDVRTKPMLGSPIKDQYGINLTDISKKPEHFEVLRPRGLANPHARTIDLGNLLRAFAGLAEETDWTNFHNTLWKKQYETTERPVNSDQCGMANSKSLPAIRRSPSKLPRIYGGVEVNPPRKYPWQVGLIKRVTPFLCGGSIISSRWILTAAHCLIDFKYKTCEPNPWTDGLQVRVGEHNQIAINDNNRNTRDYDVSRYVLHPDNACPEYYKDIALLELSRDIPFNDVIRPVCLPEDDSKTYVGEQAILTGWGAHSQGRHTHVLMEVKIPIVAQTECRTTTGNFSFDSTTLCTGALPGKSGCDGDSGGPLVVQEGNRYVLVGVLNAGDECGSSTYSSLYARVSKFLDWIDLYLS